LRKGLQAIIVLLTAALLLSIGKHSSYADEKRMIRTDFEFEYSIDEATGNAVPTLKIEYTDYADGYSRTAETLTFLDLAVKKPANGKLDFISNQHVPDTHHVADINKIYWNNNYTIKSTKEVYVSRLYEYDKTTKAMKVVKEVTGTKRYNGRIDFFPNFKGYAVNPDSYDSSNKNDVEIYALPGNKLLGKAGFAHDYDSDLNFWDYSRIMAPRTLMVGMNEKMIGVYGQTYSGYARYEMTSKGAKKKLTDLPATAKVKWEKKIGSIAYAKYYDSNQKTWLIGRKGAGKSSYVPYTHAGTEAQASFSPGNKYLLVTEYQIDAKTKNRKSYISLVIDANTGNVLRKLPQYNRKHVNHDYIWDYGDELVRVYFYEYSRAGYLNVATGIFVGSYQTNPNDASSYSGNYADLLSPEISPSVILNQQSMIDLSAQGPFLSDQNIWYVGLNALANALGATVTAQDGAWTVTGNNKTWAVKPETVISFRNQAYVPLKDFRSGLGVKLSMNAPESFSK